MPDGESLYPLDIRFEILILVGQLPNGLLEILLLFFQEKDFFPFFFAVLHQLLIAFFTE